MENPTVPNPISEPVLTSNQVEVVEIKPKSSPILLVVLIILLLLSLASTAFLYYQNMQLKNMLTVYQTQPVASPTPMIYQSPIPTADLTTGWENIVRKNWQFKVPTNWNYLECSSELIFAGPKIEKDQTIECAFDFSPGVIQVSRTSGSNRHVIPTNTDPKLDPYVSEKTTFVLDGQTATKQKESISDGPGQGVRVYVYVEKPDYTDVIILHDISQKEVFDQILSTFKFIN